MDDLHMLSVCLHLMMNVVLLPTCESKPVVVVVVGDCQKRQQCQGVGSSWKGRKAAW